MAIVLCVINWSDIWTNVIGGVLLVLLGGMLTPGFWKYMGRPLGVTCRGLFTIAAQNRQNSTDIVGMKQDIQKNGEQNALQIDQNKLIMDALGIAYMQTDAEGSVLYVSDAWCVMSGMQRDVALGNGWIDSIRTDDQREVLAVLKDVIDNDRPRRVGLTFANGQMATVAINPIRHLEAVVAHRIRFTHLHNDTGVMPGV